MYPLVSSLDEVKQANAILEECKREMRDKGIGFDEMPKDQSWRWKEAHLKDPDGNQLILFYAGRNRKNPPWRIDSKPSPGQSAARK